ncbi:hypothetical protein DPEC_G00326690 [Dallia pectoralis]|uniref:Uncharacterized protein n=1 Tax=Dallia pectoralis TaxID=75939 RepID=A0ACC2F7W0_DALPE|nr:hypothetical protein DPEC_G00326690 [Dallia pectoralis]
MTLLMFEVLGPTEPIVAVAGDDIILPCYLKPNISVEDMRVEWLNLDSDFLNQRVHRYENGRIIFEDQIPSYRGRTSLFTEELGRGNTSLKLTRLEGSDEGRYKCFIKSKDWYDDITIQVLVKAVGSRPVVSIEGHREGGMGLVCESEGWHPEPDLVWLDSKGVSLSAGPPETHRDIMGFYTVKQHVIVQETDTNLFTCRVSQSRINEEVETEVHIPSELFDYTSPWRRSFIASCCVAVITVIGSVLAVYWIHRKKDNIKKERDDLMKYVFDTIRRHAVDVTLDPVTAHPYLILSEDGKQVRCGDTKQERPDNPERFNCNLSVLGKEGFSSGRFYYEVQVKEKTGWIIGVARGTVDRKGRIIVTPDNGYWTVALDDYEAYYALTVPPFTPLSLREKPQKVGVFVDYEEGQVSFFNVETRSHIYSFTGQTLTEKLYPYFYTNNYDVFSPTWCNDGIMVTGPDSLYVTLLILLHSLTSESVNFEVLGPTEPIVAVAGDDIILPCYLKPNISVEDMTVDWRNLDSTNDLFYRFQNGKNILEDQIPSYRGRTSLFTEELWRGNTSLKLTRVQGSDEGRYKCIIQSQSWYDDVKIQVFVNAVGSRPVVSIEGHREGGMGLVCESEGWHPEPDLVWLDSKGVSLSAGPPETHRDIKGFYTVKQHVIVQETDTNLFTCRVSQSRINEEVETEVHIPSELFDYTSPWRRSFIVSCCVGVITVIGLILAAYWIQKKKDPLWKVYDDLMMEKDGIKKENDDYKKERDDIRKKYIDLMKEKNALMKERDDIRKEKDDLMKYVFDTIRRHSVDVTLDPDTAHPNLILCVVWKRQQGIQ